MVLKPEQAPEAPGGLVKTDRKHPPRASDSVALGWGLRTGLTGSQVALVLRIPGLHLEKQGPSPLSAPVPSSLTGTAAGLHPHPSPSPTRAQSRGHPCHKANPRVPPLPKWFPVSMDPFLACDKGPFNLPLGVPGEGCKAVKPAALLQPWGEPASTLSPQSRQVGRTWLPGAAAHLLSKPTQNHPVSWLLVRWHNTFFIVWAGWVRVFSYLKLTVSNHKAKAS